MRLWYVYLLAFVASVGTFIFGYNCMIMSSAILFLNGHFALSSAQEGFAMVSALYGIFAVS